MLQTQSTVTIQKLIDKVKPFAELEPIFNVPGYTDQPALTIANDVITTICGLPFPHKWNEGSLPLFYTNSYQQDYALVNSDGSSVTNIEWLERGVAMDINNTSTAKPYAYVECGRQLPQRTAAYNTPAGFSCSFIVNSFPNYSLYYGTWGAAQTGNPKLGNNPVAGSVYPCPYVLTPGAPNPSGPITQIIDANGNYLVLTGWGTEGSTAPVAPANSIAGVIATPGVGATTVWTVVDPYGLGIRMLDVPGNVGTVWQFNIVGQKTPPTYTDIKGTLFPFPDKYEPYFRAGFIAQCFQYSPFEKTRAKFAVTWQNWLKSLNDLRVVQDREQEENRFVAERTIMGGVRAGARNVSADWPFNGPRP
jgi:hypothetical protein